MSSKNLKNLLAHILFSIFFVNLLAHVFHWYESIWYFDMIMHFLGGFWVGALFFYVFPSKSSFYVIVKALLFVLLIGLGWEIYEVVVSTFTNGDGFNYSDTFSDILFDITGGLCAILYIWKKQSRLLFAGAPAR